MRVLLCGSGSLAVPTLGRLPAAGHDVVGVVTQPPRPAGRGGTLRETPVAQAARAAGLEVIEAPKINAPDAVQWIADRRPDVICVADFGQMVRAAVRAAARLDAINLHASMLPEFRGAAPINWAIIRGCRTTGLSTFSLVDKLDAGGLYVQEEMEIRPDETADELRARCADLGAFVVGRTLEMIGAGAKPRPQDEARVTLAPQLQKSDGAIDWTADATTIRNLIHGTWPWPGGQTVYCRQGGFEVHVIVARASVAGGERGPAGLLDSSLTVGTGQGRLRIHEIKPAGGRLMSWRDFVNGYRVTPGDRLVAPTPKPPTA
jgi:methionyl-tRNA formyltransferase